MGTQHLQIHTLPRGGLQHREGEEPSSAAILLRNATGRGQHGQRGCPEALGGGPAGSEPSGWEGWVCPGKETGSG